MGGPGRTWGGEVPASGVPEPWMPCLERPVMPEWGREERDGNLNFPHRPAPWTIRLQHDLGWGQSLWAKVTPLQPMGSRLGGRGWGWAALPRNLHPGSGSRSELQVRVRSQQFSEGEEAPRRKRNICTEKRSRLADPPFSPTVFVDNLSWPLRSRELCSRALGQDPGSRPPQGRGCGALGGRGPRALQRARRGSHAALGAQPRAATRVGEPRPLGYQPRAPAAPPAGPRLGTSASCAPLGPPRAPSSRHPRPSRSRTGVPAIRGCGVDERLGFGRLCYELGQPGARGVSRGCRNRVVLGRGCRGGRRGLQVVGWSGPGVESGVNSMA